MGGRRPAPGSDSTAGPGCAMKMGMRASRRLFLPLVAVLTLWPAAARASAGDAQLMPVLLALVVMLLVARLGGALVTRVGQPAVLGELLAGVVLGNLGLAGWHGLDAMRALPGLDLLAQIGVLFLLFQVGLETDASRLRQEGAAALWVATLGVVAPIGLGYLVSYAFFPAHHPLAHWFVGATLCATSVGITARVLSDLGRTRSPEGRIILGAAVIDDVQGLLVLAVVKGVIEAANAGGTFAPTAVLLVIGKALVFLVGAFALGRSLSRVVFRLGARMPGEGVLLSLALAFCFAASWLAGWVGLAPIVGAFAAGLVLDEVHYRDLRARDQADRDVQALLEPIAAFLVPLFFVLMGMRVDLAVFARPATLGFAAALTAVAIVSKQACALGAPRRVDRLTIGLGMMPRGEVGLIFAGIGSSLVLGGQPVVDAMAFSAVVVMVAVTTLITPPLLGWRLKRLPPAPG
jgi:Kef-type K+ transport system membrane component KefB